MYSTINLRKILLDREQESCLKSGSEEYDEDDDDVTAAFNKLSLEDETFITKRDKWKKFDLTC